MSRDPFANYDAWKTTDTAGEAASARQEWLDEHTYVECATCGHRFGRPDEVTLVTVTEGTISYQTAECPKCGEECEVSIVVEEPVDDRD